MKTLMEHHLMVDGEAMRASFSLTPCFSKVPLSTINCPTINQAHSPTINQTAFTLLELLIVLAIIGFLSAMALPHLKGLTRSNVMGSANQQLLDDIALARQRAINGRTVVCMVFMPPVDPRLPESYYDKFLNNT